MKIDYIREYLVLVQEMNFTAAAKKLYLTQPALSRHIASLEEHLGTRLLERTTHSVTLTQAGQEVQDHFKRIIQEYDETIRRISLFNDGFDGEFNVALLMNSANKYTALILNYMNEKFPKTRVRFSIVDVDELFNGTISGEFDVSLSLRASYKGDDYLRFHKIREVELMLLVANDSALAKRGSAPIKQLAREKLVFAKEGDSYRANVLNMLAEHKIKPAGEITTTQTLSLADAVHSENACAVVIDEMSLTPIPGCTFVPFEEGDLSLDLGWIYNALNTNPVIPQFLDSANSWDDII